MKRMPDKILAAFLCAVLCLAHFGVYGFAAQTSGICGAQLTWTLDADGTLTVDGVGEMYDYEAGTAPWWTEERFMEGAIKRIVLSPQITYIGAYAFFGCDCVEEICLPAALAGIGDFAFYYCNGLQQVQLPAAVARIGTGAFVWCGRVERYTVAAENDAFSARDGHLFTKDEKTLVRYAQGKADTAYTVPEDTEQIAAYAFGSCDMLQSIRLGDQVSAIGDFAFFDCNALSEVQYAGTRQQWTAMQIAENGNAAFTRAARWYNAASVQTRSLAGDVNGDGRINNKDVVLLLRYLNGWTDVDCIEAALDPDGSGQTESRDAICLMRYLLGQDIEIL